MRGYRNTNGRRPYSGHNSRFHNNRGGYYTEQTDEISSFCSINRDTGRIQNFGNINHLKAVAFGENKKAGRQKYLACLRTQDAFIML